MCNVAFGHFTATILSIQRYKHPYESLIHVHGVHQARPNTCIKEALCCILYYQSTKAALNVLDCCQILVYDFSCCGPSNCFFCYNWEIQHIYHDHFNDCFTWTEISSPLGPTTFLDLLCWGFWKPRDAHSAFKCEKNCGCEHCLDIWKMAAFTCI